MNDDNPTLFDALRLVQNPEANKSAAKTEPESKGATETVEVLPNEAATNGQSRGLLVPDARRALVSLLRQGVIIAAQKAKLFELVCRYQSDIEHHLADMYLTLLLDQSAGIAFVRQQDVDVDGDDDIVAMITRRTLPLYDTLVLLVLRKHYQERETAGEQRIIIDSDRLEAYLTPFLPLTNSDRSERNKLNAALKKMTERKILALIRADDERYEITPLIRYVVNAEFLENQLSEYQKIAAQHDLPTSNSLDQGDAGDE